MPLHVLLAAGALVLAQPVHEIEVTARKFAFEPATIQVVADEPVRLVLKSADSVHGFAIRELNIDVQIPKGGQPVTVEFTAPPVGRYEIACSEFCGAGHGQMRAALVSVAAPSRTPGRTAMLLFGAAAASDAATTLHFLDGHQGREEDPLINWARTPPATIAAGAVMELAGAFLWHRLTADHPRVQNAGFFVASGFHLFFATRNEYRIARNAGCPAAPCQYNCIAAFSRCS